MNREEYLEFLKRYYVRNITLNDLYKIKCEFDSVFQSLKDEKIDFYNVVNYMNTYYEIVFLIKNNQVIKIL